ncbi:hypothetical protein EK904_007377 [Melospiza melodia maxima]|nr:hypothetical protein EK904_007377 [Melospiza melodia maxima]
MKQVFLTKSMGFYAFLVDPGTASEFPVDPAALRAANRNCNSMNSHPNDFAVSDRKLEDVCKRGFTVIIDMRGSKWDLIKPLLKTLQEAFPAEIHVALIIKPDNFWQKQKTNFGSSKFIFETSMVSVEGLAKLVDPSQLTDEFEGSLDYNHDEWIELRVSLEEFFNSAIHLLSRLEDLQEMLARKEFPVDVEGSRRLIDEHTQLKKKVIKAPVEELDREGQRLLQCIRSSDGFSGRNCIPGSADFQSLVPKITSLLDKLHSTRQHLHQMWHVRKLKLDQCFQLRLFEQDAEKINMLPAQHLELNLIVLMGM